MKLIFVVVAVLASVCFADHKNEKAGGCPKPLVSTVCTKQCQNDSGCPGTQKCCDTNCGGEICVEAVAGVTKAPEKPKVTETPHTHAPTTKSTKKDDKSKPRG